MGVFTHRKMLRSLVLLAGAAVAAAFAPASMPMRATTRAAVARGPKMQSMSEAIPFMEKPANINSDMPGYAGFDPLGFSDYYDINWLKEAEIKHGRICMLAALGMLHPEFAKFPQFATFSNNPLEAFYQCPAAGWGQIIAFIGIVESFSYEKCFYGQPGDGNLGFDPLQMGKNPATLAYYKTAEVKNGRLAMIGFSGMLHHALITHKGPIDQIMTSDFYPTTSTFQQTAGVYGY